MAKVLVATKFIGFLKFSGGHDMSWTVSTILSFNIFVQSKYSYLCLFLHTVCFEESSGGSCFDKLIFWKAK